MWVGFKDVGLPKPAFEIMLGFLKGYWGLQRWKRKISLESWQYRNSSFYCTSFCWTSSKKITTQFLVVPALLWWTGSEPMGLWGVPVWRLLFRHHSSASNVTENDIGKEGKSLYSHPYYVLGCARLCKNDSLISPVGPMYEKTGTLRGQKDPIAPQVQSWS